MKVLSEIIYIGIVFSIMSCGDGNVLVDQDPEIQSAEDSATIVNYLADLGFEGDEVVVLESGVRYVILKEGDGDMIDESDIVSFDMIGTVTSDTIFDTTIKAIADSIVNVVAEDTVGKEDIDEQTIILNSFPDTRIYTPFVLTYSTSGWTIPDGFPYRGDFRFFGNGLKDGVTSAFSDMSTGGSVLIVVPSSQAFSSVGFGVVEPNEVVAFEILPIELIKQ